MQKRPKCLWWIAVSPDHRRHPCQELVVDCSFTKVIACKVGHSFAGEFGRPKRDQPPPDASAAFDNFIRRLPQGKLREFTLKELEMVTENFSSERAIGQGGFGKVFRGILSDGASVAVKVLRSHSGQGLVEFQTEIRASSAITSGSHPNIVPLIGYHYRRSKKKKTTIMIVYSFMANGDLGCYLGDHGMLRTPIDWPTRKRIALGVARGISSLHDLGIIHLDIKPSNILLDQHLDARVGDLGLSKSTGLPNDSCDVTRFHDDENGHVYQTNRICGTFGYMAPEYVLNGFYSRKTDVYGFGVTLILLVTGMSSVSDAVGQHILYMAEQLFKNEEDLTRRMHPSMLGKYDEREAMELIRLALVCIQHDPQKRPLMPEVIARMEGNNSTLKQRWDNFDCTTQLKQRWVNFDSTTSDRQLSTDNSNEASFSPIDSEISIPWTIFTSVRARGSGSVDDDMEVRNAIEFDINEEEPEENRDDKNQLQRVDDFSSSKEVDPNEGGYSKQLNLQADRQEGQSDEVATKLKEVLDQMRTMELSHQSAMEEIYQKQTAIMHSMIKMQEQYIQMVNEMQSQIDQLKEVSQKL